MPALLFALLIAAPVDTLELDLDAALRVALDGSPVRTEVSVSRTKSGSSLARGVTGLLPSVSATLGYSKSSSVLPESLRVGDDWNWTGTLSVNQVVFDPTVFAGVATGIVNSGYYAADARDKAARLVYDVTTDYLGLLKADLLREAAARSLARAEQNLKVVREKKRLGSASDIDLMQSEVQQSQAAIELLAADKALAVAQEQFKATAGIEDDVAVRATEELDEPAGFEVSDPDSLVADIERRNPGARIADKAGAAAAWNTAAAVGRALPSVNAFWSTSYADTTFPTSAGHWDDHDAASYGIRASFPLLDLKSYVLGIVDASAESRRARAAARRARLQLRSGAVAAVLGYEEARKRHLSAERNLDLNEKLHELAVDQHRLGNISLLEFLSVEANLAAASASHISALCDTYIQAANIGYLLGETEPLEGE